MTQIISRSIEEKLRASDDHSPELKEMLRNARRASDLLKAMAHESRLLVLCLLAERERSVGELEDILSLCQPTVSQQLARLRYDNLVTTRREGKTIYYSLASEDVRELIAVIYDIFCKRTSAKAAG